MRNQKRLISVAIISSVALALTGCTAADSPTDSASGGKPLTVWYADVIDANPIATAVTQGLADTLTKAGIKMTRSLAVDPTSGAIDLAVQSQALTRAVDSRPDAIAYFVLDPAASAPQVKKAMDAGIPVFAAFGKPVFPVSAYLAVDDKSAGAASATYLAEHLPKGAKIAIIGGQPTPNVLAAEAGALQALKAAGVTVVGDVEQQRNLADNADGGKKIMQGILQQFPDVQGVFAYNDDSALGAISAARQVGAHVQFTSRNGTADAVAAIKNGELLATCDLQPIQLGQALGKAIIEQITGKKQFTQTAIAAPDSQQCLITSQNAGAWKPYEKQVEYKNIPLG
jgi:ribose transport system substrate-binding protein